MSHTVSLGPRLPQQVDGQGDVSGGGGGGGSHTASLWTHLPHPFLMLLTSCVGGRRAGLPGVLRKWGLGTCYPPLALFPFIL